MKQYPVISILLVTLFFLFSASCLKEDTIPVLDDTPDIKFGQEAIPARTDRILDFSDSNPFPSKAFLLESPGCNCAYRITDFQYTAYEEVTDGQHPSLPREARFDAALWSGKNCVEDDPYTCLQFAGIYFGGHPHHSADLAKCHDEWDVMPPKGLFDFNCQVGQNATIPINFAINSIDKLESWRITFELVCQDLRPGSDYPEEYGQGYVSEPITISYPGNAQAENWGQTFVQLNGCDCGSEKVEF